jgi:nucleoside-diphosphate-sugar epimerase
MEGLTILGGNGFVGGQYVYDYYSPFIANIQMVNRRDDYTIYSPDVLYFISTVHNYNVYDQPFLDIDTNLTTLVKVLENWRKYQEKEGISHGVFNFISSWFVYGPQDKPHNVSEDAVCNPKGFYSITKRCAEQLLISYCETYGLKYRILRLGNVVGPGDKKVSSKKNALQFMIDKLSKNEDVEIYGDGLFFRDYIHVKDCSQGIDIVVSKGELNSIYNVGNGRGWYFRDIIEEAQCFMKSRGFVTFKNPSEFHQKVQVVTFYMNTDKLKALGYTPRYTGEALYRSLCKGPGCALSLQS